MCALLFSGICPTLCMLPSNQLQPASCLMLPRVSLLLLLGAHHAGQRTVPGAQTLEVWLHNKKQCLSSSSSSRQVSWSTILACKGSC